MSLQDVLLRRQRQEIAEAAQVVKDLEPGAVRIDVSLLEDGVDDVGKLSAIVVELARVVARQQEIVEQAVEIAEQVASDQTNQLRRIKGRLTELEKQDKKADKRGGKKGARV